MKKYKFALLGTPIGHSLSPDIHRIFAGGCGIEIEYNKFDTAKSQLESAMKKLTDECYSGFNCTMPLKSEIIKFIHTQSEQVYLTNSCNTVKILNGKFHGYTTDGDGMIRGIKHNGFNIEGKNIMLFGAGGTAKAVLLSLIENKAKKVVVLNRSEGNLSVIENMFTNLGNIRNKCMLEFKPLNKQNILENIHTTDILINATKAGMENFDEHADLSFISEMRKDAVVADAVYNPLCTQLMARAKDRGIAVVDGFWMLVYQGVFAFEIWTSLQIPGEYIKKAHGIVKR